MVRILESSVLPRCAAVFVAVAFVFGLAACSLIDPDAAPVKTPKEREHEANGTITGPGGILGIFGSGDKDAAAGANPLGVNAFLWRASLDTLSIWPVTSADPFGGVILTDWYAPPASPSERFKLNVYIMDRALRADGIRVAVFRQTQQGGSWQDAVVQPEINSSVSATRTARRKPSRSR